MDFLLQIQTSVNNSNFWGISYDALFMGFTPILIFILGYIINEKIKNCHEKKRLYELEEYLKSSIGILKEPLNKQIEELLKFSNSLKEKKETHLYLDHLASFDVEQIKEISSKDLYKIFIKNKKGSIVEKTELYGKLRAGIDYFDAIKKSLGNDFSSFSKQYFENEDVYRQNFKLLDEFILVMGSKSESNLIERDSFL